MIVSLAIRTGIPPQEWEEAGVDAILTALDLLNRQQGGGPISPKGTTLMSGGM